MIPVIMIICFASVIGGQIIFLFFIFYFLLLLNLYYL